MDKKSWRSILRVLVMDFILSQEPLDFIDEKWINFRITTCIFFQISQKVHEIKKSLGHKVCTRECPPPTHFDLPMVTTHPPWWRGLCLNQHVQL